MTVSYINGGAAALIDAGSPSVSMSTWSLQEGDVVIAVGANADNDGVNHTMTMTFSGGGGTQIADQFRDDNYDVRFGMWYKVMGATPDTSVTFACAGGADSSNGIAVLAFRGASTPTVYNEAGGIDSGHPNPPSVSTSSGDFVVAGGATASNAGVCTYTFPSGYTTNPQQASASDTSDVTIGLAYNSSPSTPTEDPGQFTHSVENVAFSWGAATVVLSPSGPGGLSAAPPLLSAIPTTLTPAKVLSTRKAEPGLLAATPSVLAPTKVTSTRTAEPPVITGAPTVLTPTAHQSKAEPPVLTATPSVLTPSVSVGAQSRGRISWARVQVPYPSFSPKVQPPLLEASPSVLAPTAVPGGVVAEPGLLTATPSLLVPTVVPGGVTAEPPLLSAIPSVLTPTAVPGTVAVEPPVLTLTPSVLTPTVIGAAAVEPPLLPLTPSVLAPAKVLSTRTAIPALLTATPSVLAPTVVSAEAVAPPLLVAASAVLTPQMVPGGVAVSPGLIQGAPALLTPEVIPGGVQAIVPLLLATPALLDPRIRGAAVVGQVIIARVVPRGYVGYVPLEVAARSGRRSLEGLVTRDIIGRVQRRNY